MGISRWNGRGRKRLASRPSRQRYSIISPTSTDGRAKDFALILTLLVLMIVRSNIEAAFNSMIEPLALMVRAAISSILFLLKYGKSILLYDSLPRSVKILMHI